MHGPPALPHHRVGDCTGDDIAGGELAVGMSVQGEAASGVVDEHGALATDGFRHQERLGRSEHGGVELHELQIGDGRPGAQGHGDAIAGRDTRIGRVREEVPRATGGEDDGIGGQDLAVADRHAACAAMLDDDVGGEAVLPHGDPGRSSHHRRQGTLDLATGRVAAGMDDPRGGVRGLESADEASGVVGVEDDSASHQLRDRRSSGLGHDPRRARVAEPRGGGQRVGDVRVDAVVGERHGGDAALRPRGRRVVECALGHDGDLDAARGAV